RDFKILYRRINSAFIDTNNLNEVVKYINSTLKFRFELDTISKSKPIARLDNLLLLLARDKYVFPTEDD
ncbi:hypothetical protein F5882DRAFT_312733, partial [Hyaloscypha sp. PMI_1271]